MSNRLKNESSPYLLQHAENPVDWYPWCDEALNRAKEENKPIFLSVGYSACHWCHVMEHESFENAAIAQFLNDNFISIKVDREERPDLDQIYMHAVMALQQGQGGWPLSAFLTPDQHVFFGGTYWPPHDSRGMPGFDRVLRSVLDAFQNRREQVDEQSAKVTEYLNQKNVPESKQEAEFGQSLIKAVGESLENLFDFTHGGFGRAPKFPHSMDLQVLMRLFHQESNSEQTPNSPHDSRWMKMVHLNLEKMALGGIYDHLGGGFARYSVDEKWLVPHFEKMLYDNGLLTDSYLDAFIITKSELFRQRVIETFDYQLEYMTDESGGFHSTEDADSEGVEGKFYVWTPEEICQTLGHERGALFCEVYDITDGGNFEGRNIPNLSLPLESLAKERDEGEAWLQQMAQARKELLAERDQRVRPGKDDKILVSWNALMIHSMAKGSLILRDNRYLHAAIRAADFIHSQMVQPDDRGLFHTCRHGEAKIDAYLDDYSYLINALITLYESSGESRFFAKALEWTERVISEFHDEEHGGFFFSSRSSENLIANTKEYQDSSVPSGNSMMVMALARLHAFTGNDHYRELAHDTAGCAYELILRSPSAAGQMVCGIDRLVAPHGEIVVACGDADRAKVLQIIARSYHPNQIVVPDISNCPAGLSTALVAGKQSIDEQPTVYVCQNYSCQSPLVGWSDIQSYFESNSDA